MSDIETRVARAMHDAWVLRSDSATKWDDLAQEERDNFADDARAAIAACGVEELRAEVERLTRERNDVIQAFSEASRKQGEAEGKLLASEMPGIVDGWRARAKKAESERDEAGHAADAFKAARNAMGDMAADLRASLREAALQIEYLHEKFGETGSGNAVLARIKAALLKTGAAI